MNTSMSPSPEPFFNELYQRIDLNTYQSQAHNIINHFTLPISLLFYLQAGYFIFLNDSAAKITESLQKLHLIRELAKFLSNLTPNRNEKKLKVGAFQRNISLFHLQMLLSNGQVTIK